MKPPTCSSWHKMCQSTSHVNPTARAPPTRGTGRNILIIQGFPPFYPTNPPPTPPSPHQLLATPSLCNASQFFVLFLLGWHFVGKFQPEDKNKYFSVRQPGGRQGRFFNCGPHCLRAEWTVDPVREYSDSQHAEVTSPNHQVLPHLLAWILKGSVSPPKNQQ